MVVGGGTSLSSGCRVYLVIIEFSDLTLKDVWREAKIL